MNLRLRSSSALVLAALFAVGCGGSSDKKSTDSTTTDSGTTSSSTGTSTTTGAVSSVKVGIPPAPKDAPKPDGKTVLARVANVDITRKAVDEELAKQAAVAKARKQPLPKSGTPAFVQLEQSTVASLVSKASVTIAAKQLKVNASDTDVAAAFKKLQLQYAPSKDGKSVDAKKWANVLTQNGATEAAVKENLALQVDRDKITAIITKGVTASDGDVKKYYDSVKATQFSKPATRDVRHILVKDKALADKLYAQLSTSDKAFPALAKKYSKDPGSAVKGGDLGPISQGQTVPPFDKFAFSAKNNVVSAPIKSQFGWHIIEALKDVVPKSVTPLDATLKKQLTTQVEQQRKNEAINNWYSGYKTDLDKVTVYAKGFAPAPIPPTPATSTPTPTTTG